MPANNFLALDIGDSRVGVAIASEIARLPQPYATVPNNEEFFDYLSGVVEQESIGTVVVGLPRNLHGDATEQTQKVESIVEQLKDRLSVTVTLQDEALTSVKAAAELKSRSNPYEKGDIDALAAVYILEDYLQELNP